MKTISKYFLFPLVASMGLITVSIAEEVSQHPAYPSEEGNYVTSYADDSIADARVNFSIYSTSITVGEASQHPFYPFDDAYYWPDDADSRSRVNFSIDSLLDDDEASQHSPYFFDE